MKRAIDVRAGNLLLIDGRILKVDEVDTKGAAKAHKTVCIKMRGIIDGSQRHKARAVREVVLQFICNCQTAARLARARRPAQCEQARAASQEITCRADLPLAANDARR